MHEGEQLLSLSTVDPADNIYKLCCPQPLINIIDILY